MFLVRRVAFDENHRQDNKASPISAGGLRCSSECKLEQAIYYLPTIRIVNEPGSGGPRAMRPGTGAGASAGSGPYSNAMLST
jgi:hypothetical protein